MDDANDPPATHNVDAMDVSPALHPDPADDKENDADIDAPPLAPAPAENRDTHFSYILRSYHNMRESKVYSPWHFFGGFRWRLLIFPKGNHASNHDLSVYLECGGPTPPEQTSTVGKEAAHVPPTQWNRPAKFSLHVVHPASPVAKAAMSTELYSSQNSLSDLDVSDSNLRASQAVPRDIIKETMHVFRDTAGDWGFQEFAPFSSLQRDQYADEDMNVMVMVKIRLQDNFPDPMFANPTTWDSRKQTGFVGFKNQGATCYMNSLLQTLYMLNAFRRAVYNMPLPEPGNDMTGSKLSYALQKVFYELQTSSTVVKTKRLTESFGWDTTEAFTQHDVQELKLILCDELAEKMKKVSPNEPNVLSTLFQGKILNYIECVSVDYQSTREEDFSDLSLDVKGCRNIYESFQKYTEIEMLSGDNKYKADGFDALQEAHKGVKFLKLPPVLHIHLKRFGFDCARLTMIKINDHYEFEKELDLCKFVENSDGTDVYVLHSVLVHIGDVNGGHYHAYIRPEIDISDNPVKKPSRWYKFDDETVSIATEEAAIQENFGFGGDKDLKRAGLDDDLHAINGQTPPPTVFQTRTRNYQTRRFSNAYMLQYLRKSEVSYLLKPQSDTDVPRELEAQIKKEREEEDQRRRDRAEQHLYMNIAVATNENMTQHHGSDLVDWEKVRSIRVKRALQLIELKSLLQGDGTLIDAKRMRLWKCSGRRNDTIRPDALVAGGMDTQPITDGNARLPLNPSGYSIPLQYSGRHVYYGHDDVVRMYAEELSSPFCLEPGEGFRKYMKKDLKPNGETGVGDSLRPDGRMQSEMETDGSLLADLASPAYPLVSGREVLLFLKYYTPTPNQRLQWLGHFVVDRAMKVRELHPMMKSALAQYQKKDPTLQGIDEGAEIVVFEEVAASEITKLDSDRSLESQRIPLQTGFGDILVFQQVPEVTPYLSNGEGTGRQVWDGTQETSRGDGTDMPLGGRPLPTVTSYFDYLVFKIKIEFKDKHSVGGPDEAKSIFFELLRRDSYRLARIVLAGALGRNADPDYLRFFAHDFNREAPAQEPIRLQDEEVLERVLPMHNLVNTGQTEHRVLWYERTEYHIREFDQKDEVKVVWRQDGGARATPYTNSDGALTAGNGGHSDAMLTSTHADGGLEVDGGADDELSKDDAVAASTTTSSGQLSVASNGDGTCRTFSVLVPVMSTYAAVREQIRVKLGISLSTDIRMFEVKNSKIFKFISADETIPPIMTGAHDCGAELRAEPVPEGETESALGLDYELISVVHLAKDKQPRMWRGLSFFGVPFVIKVKRSGETVGEIRKRIQEKLGIPSEEFDEWPLAEIKQLKVVYLEQPEMVYTPHTRTSVEFCSLAIEHKGTPPAKRTMTSMSRYADKPLKIRS